MYLGALFNPLNLTVFNDVQRARNDLCSWDTLVNGVKSNEESPVHPVEGNPGRKRMTFGFRTVNNKTIKRKPK